MKPTPTNPRPLLRTLKGSVIQRRDPVGKRVADRIYVHREYAHLVVPAAVLSPIVEMAKEIGFNFNCVVATTLDPAFIRLDEAPGFDTEREPIVGRYMWMYPPGDFDPWSEYKTPPKWATRKVKGGAQEKGHSNAIWHHKWMWVRDGYQGFDVDEAYEWSRTWLAKVKGPAKGSQRTWLAQLKEAGLS